MKTVIRAMGNSQGVILPKHVLELAGFARDDVIEVEVREAVVILRKPRPEPRAGWADAAATIAVTPEEREWAGFANAGDEKLEW
jgi:antitoxin MazE